MPNAIYRHEEFLVAAGLFSHHAGLRRQQSRLIADPCSPSRTICHHIDFDAPASLFSRTRGRLYFRLYTLITVHRYRPRSFTLQQYAERSSRRTALRHAAILRIASADDAFAA